jgi:DNA modification methylase
MGNSPDAYYCSANAIEIYHDDCANVFPELPAKSVDMVLTDPPYGYNYIGYKDRHAATPLANDGPDNLPMIRHSMQQAKRILKPGGVAAYFCSGSKATVFAQWVLIMAEEMDFRSLVIWRKPGLGLGSRYRGCYETILIGSAPGQPLRWYGDKRQGNVLDYSKVMPKIPDGHPTPKPLPLVEKLILLHTQPDDIIVDPFMGEGTTLVAAKRLGRGAIGIEIEERWCARAAMRLESPEGIPIGDIVFVPEAERGE